MSMIAKRTATKKRVSAFELHAFAKINLGLEVVGRRPDGYHLLRTIFQTIDLHDTLRVIPTNDESLDLLGKGQEGVTWGEENTIHRAWRAFHRACGVRQGFRVRVMKRIPPGSGLGGGSSDAGAFLLFLDHFHGTGLSTDKLVSIAAGIGADVPFFIIGGTALGEGIGDRLTPLPDLEQRDILLLCPPLVVSTRLVFTRFVLTKPARTSKINIFLKKKDLSLLENQLEKSAIELFPEIGEIKENMIAVGCTFVQMSGSGSALLGMADAARIPALRRKLPELRRQRLIGRDDYQEKVLGCRQAVRHRSLEPRYGGSNPPTPDPTR